MQPIAFFIPENDIFVYTKMNFETITNFVFEFCK